MMTQDELNLWYNKAMEDWLLENPEPTGRFSPAEFWSVGVFVFGGAAVAARIDNSAALLWLGVCALGHFGLHHMNVVRHRRNRNEYAARLMTQFEYLKTSHEMIYSMCATGRTRPLDS